ncbi:MAG: nucleotidyltransferase domain-containing protein [Thermomicrobiales bacterium]
MTDDAGDRHAALVQTVAAAYGDLPGVIAVAMAGSMATGAAGPGSDLDLYVYAPDPPPLDARLAIARRFATVYEVGNTYWEPGDEWRDRETGLHVDVMYRTPVWIEDQLDRVLVRHEPSVGYSTCFWNNVLYSRELVDPTEWYAQLRADADRPYPAPLQQAIIAHNLPLLRTGMPSYYHQIARALAREDAVAVQHRLTALLASYFDILFAVNELPHPGEKRLAAFARDRCARQPEGMDRALQRLLAMPVTAPGDDLLASIDALLDGLDTLVEAEGFLAPN